MNISKKAALLLSSLGVLAGAAGTIAMQTHAASTTTTPAATTNGQGGFRHGTPPAAAGSVTAINGNIITLTDKRTGTSYNVDASNAKIQKFSAPASGSKTPPSPATISISDIAVGDNIMVQGTVSGTNITATEITDGMFMGGPGGFRGRGPQGAMGTMGTVSAVNGNTITLTGANGTTYTIDASSAAVKKLSSVSVSDIAVGDKLQVNGTVSGNNVSAKNILDGFIGGPGKGMNPNTTPATPQQ